MSDRIRVTSIVGRFLEHSRLWQFANGGDEEYYLGSADWMPRNFDRRVEAVAPVESPASHERLRSLLSTYLDDNRQAWRLDADGVWCQREPDGAPRASLRTIDAQFVWASERLPKKKSKLLELDSAQLSWSSRQRRASRVPRYGSRDEGFKLKDHIQSGSS